MKAIIKDFVVESIRSVQRGVGVASLEMLTLGLELQKAKKPYIYAKWRMRVKFVEVWSKLIVNHHIHMVRYGVQTARRGWATKADVINAWPLAKLRKWLTSNGMSSGRPRRGGRTTQYSLRR